MSSKLCPECNVVLTKESYCFCGWRGNSEKLSSKKIDYRCHYSCDDERCPSLGTISNSTKSTGALYCLDHYETLGNPQKAKEALKNAVENQHSIQNKRIDWRIKLWQTNQK